MGNDEEKLEEIKKAVFKHPKAAELHIKRIPEVTADIFKKFANDQFVGDYGFCLKHILEEALEYEELKKRIVLEDCQLVIRKK